MLPKRSAIFVGLLLAVAGCDSDNPLAPSSVPLASTSTSTPSAVEPTLDTNPNDSAPVSDPGGDTAAPPPRYTIEGPRAACIEMGRHTWTITVRDAGDRLRGASFFDPEAGCEATNRRAGGSFSVLEENLPGVNTWEWGGAERDHTGELCGRYQADIAIGSEDFETIVGAVIDTGRHCEPDPPVEPPTCEELGNCEPPPCEELGNCEPPPCEELGNCEPPPCEELNQPEFDVSFPFGDIEGSATVENQGEWVLTLYATSDLSEYQGDDPDYTKDSNSARVVCGDSDTLAVAYNWHGHPARYWWVVLMRDGAVVFKSDPVDHQEVIQ